MGCSGFFSSWYWTGLRTTKQQHHTDDATFFTSSIHIHIHHASDRQSNVLGTRLWERKCGLLYQFYNHQGPALCDGRCVRNWGFRGVVDRAVPRIAVWCSDRPGIRQSSLWCQPLSAVQIFPALILYSTRMLIFPKACLEYLSRR